MGAGLHGSFGTTYGFYYRVGNPVPPSEKSLIMSLNPEYYTEFVAKKYNIHLKSNGKRIKIIYDPNLAAGQYGLTLKSKPYEIRVGREALSNEEQLANTIAHELKHARDFIKKGTTSEYDAYRSGDRLSMYIKGEI